MHPLTSIHCSRSEGPRSFKWFLASIFISALGRNVYQIACAWLLIVSGHGSAGVAAFFAIVSVVELIASPIAGWMSDRYNRRVLYVIADAIRCVGAAVFAAVLTTNDPLWSIWLSSILFTASDRISLTTSQCMIPSVGVRFRLTAANSIVCFLIQSGSLCAASLTGFLLHVSTPASTFAAMAVAFALSTFCMLFVRWEQAPHHALTEHTHTRIQIDMHLIFLSAIYAFLYTGGMLVSVVGPSFVFEELEGNAIDFGHLESAWSAGSILGVLLLIPLVRVAKICVLQLVILALTALFFALLKVLDLPMIFAAFATLGILYNLGRVGVEVMLQSTVTESALGRAKGAVHCVGVLLGLILFAGVAVVSDDIQPSTIFLIFACTLATGVIFLGICRSRHSR